MTARRARARRRGTTARNLDAVARLWRRIQRTVMAAYDRHARGRVDPSSKPGAFARRRR